MLEALLVTRTRACYSIPDLSANALRNSHIFALVWLFFTTPSWQARQKMILQSFEYLVCLRDTSLIFALYVKTLNRFTSSANYSYVIETIGGNERGNMT